MSAGYKRISLKKDVGLYYRKNSDKVVTPKETSLKKDLGLYYEPLKNVGVPEKVIGTANDKMAIYQRRIKEFAHATPRGKLVSQFINISGKAKERILNSSHSSIKSGFEKVIKPGLEKLRNTAKYSEIYKAETERIGKLKGIFTPIYEYLKEVEEYFEGCKGVDKIKKYNQKIKKDCENLKKKGYFDITTVGEKEFSHFDKSKYNLSFISQLSPDANPSVMNIQKPKRNSITPPNKTKTYKSICLESFTNLRTIFSTYLSLINDVYAEKYNQIKKIPEGTRHLFEAFRKKLDEVMPKYEHCAAGIVNEMKKRDIYFKYIVRSKKVKAINETVDDNRRKLQESIGCIKNVLLKADFISVSEGHDYKEHKSLMDMLRSLNDNINNIAIYISGGNYGEFESTYETVLDQFEKLPPLVTAFQTAGHNADDDFSHKLDQYENLIRQCQEKVDKAISEMEKNTEKFKGQFRNFVKSLVKTGVKTVFSAGLSAASIFWNPAVGIGATFNTLTSAVIDIAKDVNNLPNLQ